MPPVPSSAESGGQGYAKTPGALHVVQQTEPEHVLQTLPKMSGNPGILLASDVAAGTMDRVEVTRCDPVCSTDLGGSIAAAATACGASLGPAWLETLNIPMCPAQSGTRFDAVPWGTTQQALICEVALLFARLVWRRRCLQSTYC